MVAVLLSPDGRVIAQRRTRGGGYPWAVQPTPIGLVWSQLCSSHARSSRKPGVGAGSQDPSLRMAWPGAGGRGGGGHLPPQADCTDHRREASGANDHQSAAESDRCGIDQLERAEACLLTAHQAERSREAYQRGCDRRSGLIRCFSSAI